MGFGDFENFNNWSARDHALNKMVFDEAVKKGGGGPGGGKNNGNANAAFWALIAVIIAVICLLKSCG